MDNIKTLSIPALAFVLGAFLCSPEALADITVGQSNRSPAQKEGQGTHGASKVSLMKTLLSGDSRAFSAARKERRKHEDLAYKSVERAIDLDKKLDNAPGSQELKRQRDEQAKIYWKHTGMADIAYANEKDAYHKLHGTMNPLLKEVDAERKAKGGTIKDPRFVKILREALDIKIKRGHN